MYLRKTILQERARDKILIRVISCKKLYAQLFQENAKSQEHARYYKRMDMFAKNCARHLQDDLNTEHAEYCIVEIFGEFTLFEHLAENSLVK